MSLITTQEYAARLPIPMPRHGAAAGDAGKAVPPFENLPKGLVVGTNLIGFEDSVTPPVREGVSLSLLAAQKVAEADDVVNSPDLWVERHDMVLKGLNWTRSQAGTIVSDFAARNVSVHEAVIPILSSAFGGLAVGGLMIKALEQMATMNDEPWITLFERESRRLDVTEYRFGVVQQVASAINLRIASARLVATEKRIQILFFKSRSNDVQLRMAQADFSVHEHMLNQIVAGLKPRLEQSAANFIDEMPL